MESGIILSLLISIPTWVMLFPIGICSLLLVTVFIERLIFFKVYSRNVAVTVKSSIMLYLGGSHKDAISILKADSTSVSRVILSIIEARNSRDREKVINEGVHVITNKIERFSGLVSTISTISPMFGLLGTVTGMMKSFNALAKSSQEAQNLLANGIAEALVTTATGLLVAIPAVIFYNYMVARSSQLLNDLEVMLNSITDTGK
ncbi:MAG: MotA/TolQ/ExbB proton channel family protein [Spirochaetes bacterium]|jgi:biopolymer transport protein ExbB|nr:MotA/TolQ/ExbB proton channel family protein [Spirochaetota bacterium]